MRHDAAATCDVLEIEPQCAPGYWDHSNGGCNSDPPVFAPPLFCGQVLSGITGTTWNDDGTFRDTDWFPISIPGTESVVLRWCVFAPFAPLITILRAGSCDSLVMVSEVHTGEVCDTVCATATVRPGDYWLYVSPASFYGVPCGSQYRAWTVCAPCTVDTVRDVTICRIENEIVLRWTTRADFLGTYNVYASTDFATWQLLRTNLGRDPDHARASFADTTAFSSFRCYLVTSTCP